MVAPVMSSPCAMAWATGAAPRQAGSSEKCRFTHPCRGISSAACGISAPYAVTGQQSGASARRWRRKPSSRGVGGLSTSRPTSAARSATGLGPTRRPRPAGASGRVMTAATSCRDLSSASSEGTAAAGVPANTRRILRPRLVSRAAPAAPFSLAPQNALPHVRCGEILTCGAGSLHHSASRISFMASFLVTGSSRSMNSTPSR